jgi:ABC-2 type transport system permease protein
MTTEFMRTYAIITTKRCLALCRKELRQTLRDKRLLFLLLVLPLVQLLSYGFALNPELKQLPLGYIDYSKSELSRNLITSLTENKSFRLEYIADREDDLLGRLSTSEIAVAVIIPSELNVAMAKGRRSQLPIIIDGVNANTAKLAKSALLRTVEDFRIKYASGGNDAAGRELTDVQTEVSYLYNPGLVSSWFIVSGILGIIVTLVGSTVSAASIVREKEIGTMDNLLMLPVTSLELLIAKVAPLAILILVDVLIILVTAHLVFGMPLYGSFLSILIASVLYLIWVIELGILVGTLFNNQQQTQLMTFSLNIPLGLLCGAMTSIESMPAFFQLLASINPLRHYVVLLRGFLIMDTGWDVLWPHMIVLIFYVIGFAWLSLRRFRLQLSH